MGKAKQSKALGLALALSLGALGVSMCASAQSSNGVPDKGALRSVMALYGLDEAGAAERLGAEARAAEVDQHIRAIGLAGYAGSWFDADTLALKVASADPADFPVIRQLGGVPVSVDWSLERLRAVREEKVTRLKASLPDSAVASASLDVIRNRVVIGVAPEQLGAARTNLGESEVSVVLVEVRHTPTFSSGPVRGANGTRNATWALLYSGEYPCSIGVSVNEGFLFAGHCGDEGHEIRTPPAGNILLGYVEASTFAGASGGPHDAAWVKTESGWTPTAQINGYSDGTLSVPASWAGMLKATLGATICRYGQTTGGPHCGTITNMDHDGYFSGVWMEDMVEVADSCTEDGDSGGPHLALATGQIQGVNVGGGAGTYGDLIAECPKPPPFVQPTNRKVYFQPIEEALNLMGRTMLTSHGAAAPVVENNFCEGLGWGLFMCYTGYRSQGQASLSWSLGMQTGTGTAFSGSCAGGPASALLTVTNPYGSSGPVSTPFYCHAGSPP